MTEGTESEVEGMGPKQRERLRFDWSEVSEPVLRRLLEAAYEMAHEDNASIEELDKAGLERQARRVYGSPPSYKKLDAHDGWRVIRQFWLSREATLDELRTLAAWVRRGLAVDDRDPTARTRNQLVEFFNARRLTANFTRNLHNAFKAAHRTKQATRSGSSSMTVDDLAGPVELVGQNSTGRHVPYAHQLAASRRIEALLEDQVKGQRRGLLVMPTGAGKTATVVGSLVPWLAADRSRRVLWLAHQRELLIQARIAFERAALVQKPEFLRVLRIITSGGSTTSTLGDSDLSVALVTWQTLHAQQADQRTRRLRAYLMRPTAVVIDEAHHAAAPAYQAILKTVLASEGVVVIGMTATPWPSSRGAGAVLRSTFPTDLYSATVEQMYEAGVLATPVIYSIDTKSIIDLTPAEKRLVGGDLPQAVLRKLKTPARNQSVVDTWLGQRDKWGKTLLFATDIGHADTLADLLEASSGGPRVKALHSRIEEPRHDVLSWFEREKGPCVLVSVGMLTEGVDLPDANTAFLARPTASRILMRQMIGRVLRGKNAGGSETANLVYFRDEWVNFDEVIEPGELPDINPDVTVVSDWGTQLHRLPPILDENGTGPIAADVLAQIERMYSERTRAIPVDPTLIGVRLIGYYQLDVANIPVFDHQREGYDELISSVLRGDSFQGKPALRLFDDGPPPYPTIRAVNMVIDYVRTYETAPTFREIRASLSPREVALELRRLPAMTVGERERWLEERYEAGLARFAYESFEYFEEAVDRERRELAFADRHVRSGGSIEFIPERPSRPSERLGKSTRDLPDKSTVLAKLREALVEEPEVLSRLDVSDVPIWQWSDRPLRSAWAYWTMPTTGKSRGRPRIRVNRLLRAPRTQVSEELILFLLYHEMLHHLLPGQGHDAEFRRLESRWPDADALDREIDTLAGRFELGTKSR